MYLCTKLGEDIQFEDLMKMGFSAVLASHRGLERSTTWHRRDVMTMSVKAWYIKTLLSIGLIICMNLVLRKMPIRLKMASESLVEVLASLDVAKVLMFELVQKALKERGHEIDLFALDRSIAKVLDEKGLTLEDLGIKGCTLFYRRRIKDMPLSPGDPITPEEIAKAEAVREKILNNYRSKYLFNVAANHVPVDKIVEGDQLVGLIFQETEVTNGKVRGIAGSEKEIRFPYVISSIGSLPDIIPGIPACGSTYEIEDEVFCRLSCYSNVFALGNAVTGRGNIKESLDHGREIAQNVIEGYLSNAEGDPNHAVMERIAHALEKLDTEDP